MQQDTSERGWFSRLRYPVALVQTFRPCDWNDLSAYICEGERFSTIMKERIAWLGENRIKFNIRYDYIEDEEKEVLEDTRPRLYRLFVEFTCTADAIVYRLRWD